MMYFNLILSLILITPVGFQISHNYNQSENLIHIDCIRYELATLLEADYQYSNIKGVHKPSPHFHHAWHKEAEEIFTPHNDESSESTKHTRGCNGKITITPNDNDKSFHTPDKTQNYLKEYMSIFIDYKKLQFIELPIIIERTLKIRDYLQRKFRTPTL